MHLCFLGPISCVCSSSVSLGCTVRSGCSGWGLQHPLFTDMAGGISSSQQVCKHVPNRPLARGHWLQVDKMKGQADFFFFFQIGFIRPTEDLTLNLTLEYPFLARNYITWFYLELKVLIDFGVASQSIESQLSRTVFILGQPFTAPSP